MLVLDDLELEMETVKELLSISLLKPSKFVIEILDELASTKYGGIVSDLLKNICPHWIKNNPSLIPLLLRFKNINEDISKEIINQMQTSFASNFEQYKQLSKSMLMFIFEHSSTDIYNVRGLIETSLLAIDRDKTDIIIQLFDTKYADFILDIINSNCVEWIVDEDPLSVSMLKLIQLEKSFVKKITQEMQEAYAKSSVKYNELSTDFLSVCSVLDLSSKALIDIFKISTKSITRKKAKLIVKLRHGKYSQIIEKIAEDEFINWISGTNKITPAVYILNLIEGFKRKDVSDFFALHIDGDERSIIEALQVVDVFYWYHEMSRDLPQFQRYRKFAWNCIEDSRIAVSLSALVALSFTVNEQLSLSESKRIMNALCKIITNRPLPRNLLHLYSYLSISKEVQGSANILDFNKQTILDVLSYNFSVNMKEGALIAAMLHKCIDLSAAQRFMNQIELDESQKERINKFINLCYGSTTQFST